MQTKSSLKNSRVICAVIIFAVVFLFGYKSTNAATLEINSNLNTIYTGDLVTLTVLLNSEGVAINNAEATIVFPTDSMEIVSINKINSVFSLWVEDPTFSNFAGTISFNGGIPTPGFNGTQGLVLSIVAKAKKTGLAEFTFSNAAVRSNDGLGTDVMRVKQGRTITIAKDKEQPILIVTNPTSNLQLSSLTHPNQDQWYKDSNPKFQWVVSEVVDAVQTGIGSNTSSVPQIIYSPAISEKTIKDLDDGVWYFKVRARKDGVWGSTSTYIVRIDTKAPQKKNVTFNYDNSASVLNISANIQDITSGIERYEIYINDVLKQTVPAKEFIGGKYSLGMDAFGDNVVKLVAIDRAGNSVDASGSFRAENLLIPRIDPIPPAVSAEEQLLISGRSQLADSVITVFVKHDDNEPIVFKTESNSDRTFFVLSPKLKSGNYDIWAEAGPQGKVVSSTHVSTKATSHLLIAIGSYTAIALSLIVPIVIVLLLLTILIYFLAHSFSRFKHRQKMRTALVRGDNSKILRLLRKRLEKHLELLHHTRLGRVLTKEEKEIREAIERDLDDVDQAILEQEVQ